MLAAVELSPLGRIIEYYLKGEEDPRLKTVGMQGMFQKGLRDKCTHCWKCGNTAHFAYNCPQRNGSWQENCPRLPVAKANDVESHHCIGCKQLHKNIFVCAACKTSKYCSKACQIKDWANHKQIFLAIQEISDKFERVEHGRGDSEDHRVFVSHLTPQGQEKLSKLVGRKCFIKCSMNGVYFWNVDDTYTIFKTEADCDTFLKHLNNLHPALQFTFEKEENDSLPF